MEVENVLEVGDRPELQLLSWLLPLPPQFVLSQDDSITGYFIYLHHLIRTLGQALRARLAA